MLKAKLGMSPIAWWNDDLPELSDDVSLEECLRQSRSAGFTGMELGQRFPTDPAEMLPILRAADVTLCGGWFSGTLVDESLEVNQARIQPMIELFKAVDAPCIVYGEVARSIQGQQGTPLDRKAVLSYDEMAAYARRVTQFGEWAAEQGMPLAYHHHMGTIIESGEDVDRLMDATPPEVHLCYDTGHLAFGGADPLAVLDRWGERALHVHYKDIRLPVVEHIRATDGSFLDAVIAGAFTVPGDAEGHVDFAAVTERLAKMDYDGWIVVEAEQDPAKAPPYAYSKLGYDTIVAACRAAGLDVDAGG